MWHAAQNRSVGGPSVETRYGNVMCAAARRAKDKSVVVRTREAGGRGTTFLERPRALVAVCAGIGAIGGAEVPDEPFWRRVARVAEVLVTRHSELCAAELEVQHWPCHVGMLLHGPISTSGVDREGRRLHLQRWRVCVWILLRGCRAVGRAEKIYRPTLDIRVRGTANRKFLAPIVTSGRKRGGCKGDEDAKEHVIALQESARTHQHHGVASREERPMGREDVGKTITRSSSSVTAKEGALSSEFSRLQDTKFCRHAMQTYKPPMRNIATHMYNQNVQ